VSKDRRRRLSDSIARGLVYVAAAVALLPLTLVLVFTVAKGLPAVTNIEFFLNSERPVGIPGGGVANAIAGTVLLVAMASVISIPVGIISGIFLAEYGRGRLAGWVRLACDVLVGTPSIAIGLFVYAFLVAPFKQFSAFSGSVALAILMLPVVVRTTESAVVLVPNGLRESGLALGLPRWRVSLQLILPAAAAGVLTGALLSVARAAGESAPLLFTAFGNTFFSLKPTQPIASLPVTVYKYALQPYVERVNTAWGCALILIVLTLIVNLASRFALRRQIAMTGKAI
jgi:phosphate transport system permease protein